MLLLKQALERESVLSTGFQPDGKGMSLSRAGGSRQQIRMGRKL